MALRAEAAVFVPLGIVIDETAPTPGDESVLKLTVKEKASTKQNCNKRQGARKERRKKGKSGLSGLSGPLDVWSKKPETRIPTNQLSTTKPKKKYRNNSGKKITKVTFHSQEDLNLVDAIDLNTTNKALQFPALSRKGSQHQELLNINNSFGIPWVDKLRQLCTEHEAATTVEHNLTSIAQLRGLTLLTGSTKKEPTTQAVESDVDIVLQQPDKDETETLPTIYKRLNLSKIRDRWLDHVRNRPIVLEQVVITSNRSSSSEESFAEDPVATKQPFHQDDYETSDQILLLPVYYNSNQPLHHAIERNDEKALRALLKQNNTTRSRNDNNGKDTLTPLQLVVELDQPNLLRILLQHKPTYITTKSTAATTAIYPPLVIAAVNQGRDECLELLLTDSPSRVLDQDTDGNTVLHLVRRTSTLQLVLNTIDGMLSLLSKSLLARTHYNKHGDTPLHAYSRNNRVDLVEYLVRRVKNTSLLKKLLVAHNHDDDTPLLTAVKAGSADVVMSMLLRNNNNNSYALPGPCPLVCAARTANVDMLRLLLEFEKEYHFVQALREVVASSNDVIAAECSTVLVQAGANPCALSTTDHARNSCALTMAASRGHAHVLTAMINAYNDYLQRVRQRRRSDHLLQKQPESFFAGIESRENAEKTVAMRDALVTSLFHSWKQDDCVCCKVLYAHGADLGLCGLKRLESSLANGMLTPASAAPCPSFVRSYEVSLFPAIEPDTTQNDWSRAMLYPHQGRTFS
jgi:ankyrin repeat protein